MEKLVFLFGRKPGLSPEEFARHYLEVHAPLGLRVTRAMSRYVVNLADLDQAPAVAAGVERVQGPAFDAITEIWTPSVEAFFDPSRAFTSPEAGRELMADHDSFIGPMHAYLVTERVVTDDERTGPLRERSPGVKYVSLRHRDEGTNREGAHHPGVCRHVEDTVVRPLTPDAPPVDAFVSVRFGTVDDLRDWLVASASVSASASSAPGCLVSEYVQKA